jgi:hypothetical protein
MTGIFLYINTHIKPCLQQANGLNEVKYDNQSLHITSYTFMYIHGYEPAYIMTLNMYIIPCLQQANGLNQVK